MNKVFSKAKTKVEKFQKKINWDEMTINEKMFQIIAIIGSILSLFSLIETIFLAASVLLITGLVVLFILVMSSLWISILRKKIKVAAIICGAFLNFLMFPTLFFFSGALQGGASVWLVLGYFYVYIMFSGTTFWIFILATIAVDVGTYTAAFLYPELVVNQTGKFSEYSDSLYSVIIVGFAIGILIRIMIGLYDKEQKKAHKRAEELEKTAASRNRLFAGMSHEIRTPINTIMGLNELIERSEPSAEVLGYTDEIDNASEMLLSFVNDILDFSRLEMDQLEIIDVEYSSKDMFTSLYDMMSVQSKNKGLEFNVEVDTQFPSTLFGDDKRIKQILINLLSNAVKYTEKGSVSLEATGEKNADGIYLLRVTVFDTGIGIKKEDIEHIYDSFSRFDEKKNNVIEGSGLGLSIVKQLVDMMGGTINVDSIYTKGTIFTVTIPQKVINHTPVGLIRFGQKNIDEKKAYRQKFEAPDARILIVDDNRVNSIVTSRLLASTRMQIYTATSGKECLEMTKHKLFHLILMDYMMPEMDGAETLAALRTQENGLCKETPVIALTATTKGETEDESLEYEFNDFLEKPIRSELLEEAILNFLPSDIIEYKQENYVYKNGDGETNTEIKKKRKVRITTDSTCDLPRDILSKNGVHIQNLYISTPQGRFVDSLEIDANNLSQYIHLQDVKSVSCSIDEFENFFADNLVDAVDVIHISLTSGNGVTYAHAVEAAKGFDHVHVVDSQNVSVGEALLVLEAARLANAGKSANEILKALEECRERIDSGFLTESPDTLHSHFHQNRSKYGFLKFFHLHPVLRMKNYRVSFVGFMSGEKENLWRKYVGHRLRRVRRIDNQIIVISFASCPALLQSCVLDEIGKRVGFDNVIICKSSFSNAVNCGPETFGFAFYTKN